MKAREIVGKRVTAVKQTRFYNERMGRPDVQLNSIHFENGAILILHVGSDETEDFCYGEVIHR